MELPRNPAASNQPNQPEPDATEAPREQKSGSLLDDAPTERDVTQASKAEKPAKPKSTPEQEYMAKAITQEVDPVEHIMLKPAPVLTEKDADAMIGHDAYWLDGGRHPLGDPLQKKTKEYFENLYPEP